MAQHDYVIDNSTGANVRADINSVLQAIASNNSGSSAPSTTYALQSFANTTSTMLQLRNAANNAFVNLRKFDGTLPLPDGSATSPSLFFDDDTNTGIFSSADNKINFTTGGTEKFEIGSETIFNENGEDIDFRIESTSNQNLFKCDAGNSRVGINISAPLSAFNVNGEIFFGDSQHSNNSVAKLSYGGNSGILDVKAHATGNTIIAFTTSNSGTHSEKLRIDSSGRLLSGATSSSSSVRGVFRGFAGDGGAGQGIIHLEVNKTTTNCGNGENLGSIRFGSNEGHVGALIGAQAESAWSGSSDLPSFINFFTCPDGSSTLTERMRITSTGNVGIGRTDPPNKLRVEDSASGVIVAKQTTNNGGFNTFEGKSSSGTTTFYASHNGRVGASEGIIFGSDTSSDNILDDYEEGTYTPSLTFASDDGNKAYATRGGSYTKIGRKVTVNININLSNRGTGSGLAKVSLPFTVGDRLANTSFDGGGFAYLFLNLLSSVSTINLQARENTTTAELRGVLGTASGNMGDFGYNFCSNNTEFRIQVTYFT